MDSKSEEAKPTARKRAYARPILLRLGSLRELTRTLGTGGVKDGMQTTNIKRTSL